MGGRLTSLFSYFPCIIEYVVYLPYPWFELEAIKEHGTVNPDDTTSIPYGILFEKTAQIRE